MSKKKWRNPLLFFCALFFLKEKNCADEEKFHLKFENVLKKQKWNFRKLFYSLFLYIFQIQKTLFSQSWNSCKKLTWKSMNWTSKKAILKQNRLQLHYFIDSKSQERNQMKKQFFRFSKRERNGRSSNTPYIGKQKS